MKQLKIVVLTETRVTAAGVAKLQQALPDCAVIFTPSPNDLAGTSGGGGMTNDQIPMTND